ncbi:MAG: SAM-dependent chlorinase/fluorinase [Planctomycetes bacterium]|nr:SAM-dependent chlorinase/fluorinase [Planctomycetota bacterium]
MPIISLLTDFGQESFFPAAMKGVILDICSEARIVDITHAVPEHDIVAGSYALYAVYRHFPAGTIHVAVVDPGVGSKRQILAVEMDGHIFLVPDNGLMSFLLKTSAPDRIFVVENRDLMAAHVAPTFHGRDIFAPVAAHLARGVPVEMVGPQVNSLVRLDISSPRRVDDGIEAEIIAVDRFGNLVTNVPGEMLPAGRQERMKISLRVSGTTIQGVHRTYADVQLGELVTYVGSAGLLEIGRNRASARDVLGAGVGHPVRIVFGE